MTAGELMVGGALALMATAGAVAMVREGIAAHRFKAKVRGHKWTPTVVPREWDADAEETMRAQRERAKAYRYVSTPHGRGDAFARRYFQTPPDLIRKEVAERNADWQALRDRMFPPSLQHYWVPNGEHPGPDGRWWVFLGATRTIWGFTNREDAVTHADRQNQLEQRGKYHPGRASGVMIAPYATNYCEGCKRETSRDFCPRCGRTFDGGPDDHNRNVRMIPYRRPTGMSGGKVTYEHQSFPENDPPGNLTGWEPVVDPELRAAFAGQRYDTHVDDVVLHHVALVPEGTPGATGYIFGMDTGSGSDATVIMGGGSFVVSTPTGQDTVSAADLIPANLNDQGQFIGRLQDDPAAHYEAIATSPAMTYRVTYRVALTAPNRPALMIGRAYSRLRDAKGVATRLNRKEGRG